MAQPTDRGQWCLVTTTPATGLILKSATSNNLAHANATTTTTTTNNSTSISTSTSLSTPKATAPFSTSSRPISLVTGLLAPKIDVANIKEDKLTNVVGTYPPSNTSGQVVAARLMDMGKKLLEAAREGRTDHVRQLVVSSGAPFTSDWLGTTALHLAAQYGHAEIAEILLRGGVNRDARTKLERTALHLAAQCGSLGVVDLLLIHGSDVNARDMLKMTPLHWAVERGHVCVAQRLLFGGSDIYAKNKFHLTPIDIARNSNRYEMIQLFKSATNKHDEAIGLFSQLTAGDNLSESHEMFDADYAHLSVMGGTSVEDATTSRAPIIDIHEPCIDLVEFEWNALKFESDLFLPSDEEDEPKVEYLMKIVEELQKENRQLRQKVEQLSTTSH